MFYENFIFNLVIFYNWNIFVTWYPFSINSNCGRIVNLVFGITNWFQNKLPTNFNFCNCTVTWNSFGRAVKSPFRKTDPGYLIAWLNSIANPLNISVKYLVENEIYLSTSHENKPFPKDLISGKIDLAITTTGNSASEDNLERSITVAEGGYYIVVPPGKILREGFKMVNIFSWQIWLLILFTMIVACVVSKFQNHSNWSCVAIEYLQMTLQVSSSSFSKHPRRHVSKGFSLYYLLYVTIMVSAVATQLSSILTRPNYELPTRTIRDLFKNNKKLKYHSNYHSRMEKLFQEIDLNLTSIKIPMNDSIDHPAFVRIFGRQCEFGTVLTETWFDYYNNPEELQVLKNDRLFIGGVFVRSTYGHPIMPMLNYWTTVARETGLVQKWIKDSINNQEMVVISCHEDNLLVPLQMKHLEDAFVSLGVGYFLALLVFIVENLYTFN